MKIGLLGKKIGMTRVYDAAGKITAATVIEAGGNVQAQLKTEEKDGKKLMIQEYENGDECPGFGKRYTLVEYTVRCGRCCFLCLAVSYPPPLRTPSRSARRKPRGLSSCPSPSTMCANTA